MANITTDDIKTISDFPLLPKADIAPADVILVEDISASAYKKTSLQDVVDKMNPIQSVNLTTAEYNALTDAQKNNGTYYNITDSESTVQDELSTLSATVATQAETITSLQSGKVGITNGIKDIGMLNIGNGIAIAWGYANLGEKTISAHGNTGEIIVDTGLSFSSVGVGLATVSGDSAIYAGNPYGKGNGKFGVYLQNSTPDAKTKTLTIRYILIVNI